MGWSVRNAKSVAAVWTGLTKALPCAFQTGSTTVYECIAEDTTWIKAVSKALCVTAGRTFSDTASGSTGCNDNVQPSGTPSGTPGTAASPANVAYGLFALILAAVFAL